MSNIEIQFQEKCLIPSDIFEHLHILRSYAKKCNHVTELGVRAVVSTWAFLAAYPKRLISVDIANPIHHGGDLGEAIAAAHKARIEFQFIEADDRTIKLEETDLLFIDTLHTYDQLKTELTLHSESSRKFIILHDTETFGLSGEVSPFGLKPALMEFFLDNGDGRNWRVREHLKNCNGLTVLERCHKNNAEKKKHTNLDATFLRSAG